MVSTSFLMNTKKDDWKILALQNKILEIAVFIHKLCIENNIKYFLMGGSALGAIRHNGFIPWDDDLDIFMTPNDYEKFRNVFLKSSTEKTIDKYYLQEFGLVDGMVTMAKVRDSSTTLIEKGLEDWNINQGVYVDIFILHNAGQTKFQIKKQLFWSRYLIAKGLSTKGYKGKTFPQKIILFVMKLSPARFLLKTALKNIYRYRNRTSQKVVHFLGRAGMKKGIYDSDSFEKPVLHDFEKTQLFVPNNLEKYVIERWGTNYNTPPSLEKIKAMQHPSFWDVEKPYLMYQDNIKCKKNERKLIV